MKTDPRLRTRAVCPPWHLLKVSAQRRGRGRRSVFISVVPRSETTDEDGRRVAKPRQGSLSLNASMSFWISGLVKTCSQHSPAPSWICTSTGCVSGSGSSRFRPPPLIRILALPAPLLSLIFFNPPAAPVSSLYLKPDDPAAAQGAPGGTTACSTRVGA